MTTVDDILADKPSLKLRAKAAYQAARVVEEARRREEEGDLIASTVEWLQNTLGCSLSEVMDLEFTPGPFSSNGDDRMLTFELDGVKMRARFVKTKIMEVQTGGSFTNETIWDKVLRVDMTKTMNSWTQVTSLADLGAQLP